MSTTLSPLDSVAGMFLTPPRAVLIEWDVPHAVGTFPLEVPPGWAEQRLIDVTYYLMGEGPPVLLVHGWAGQATDLAAIARGLIASGFSVAALDLPAHGRSQGQWTSIPLCALALRGVAERVGAVHAAVAHSFGGPVLLHAMTQGLAAQAAVFVSPPASYAEQARKVAGMARLGRAETDQLLETLSAEIGIPIEEVSFQRQAISMNCPALFLHSRDDRIVTAEESIASAQAWPGAQHRALDGLGHRKILDDAGVVKFIIDFIQN